MKLLEFIELNSLQEEKCTTDEIEQPTECPKPDETSDDCKSDCGFDMDCPLSPTGKEFYKILILYIDFESKKGFLLQNKTEHAVHSYTAGKGWIYCITKNADQC